VTTTHVVATHRLTRLLATKHTVLVEKFDINTPTEGTCSVDVKELGIQEVPDQADSAAKQFLRYLLLGASSAASQVPTYELSFHPCVSSLGRSLCDTKIIWNRSPPHLSILSPSVSVEHQLLATAYNLQNRLTSSLDTPQSHFNPRPSLQDVLEQERQEVWRHCLHLRSRRCRLPQRSK
jgi:hypothetical protein